MVAPGPIISLRTLRFLFYSLTFSQQLLVGRTQQGSTIYFMKPTKQVKKEAE